jgi:hypothetical protein
MNEDYDSKLCQYRHTIIDATLKDHTERIDLLEKNNAVNHVEIKNLIAKMDTFITVIMWGLGIFITASGIIAGIVIKFK